MQRFERTCTTKKRVSCRIESTFPSMATCLSTRHVPSKLSSQMTRLSSFVKRRKGSRVPGYRGAISNQTRCAAVLRCINGNSPSRRGHRPQFRSTRFTRRDKGSRLPAIEHAEQRIRPSPIATAGSPPSRTSKSVAFKHVKRREID